MTSSDRPVRIATVGAAASANKGAASMLQAVIDHASDHVGPCRVDVLSTYPDTDRQELPHHDADTRVNVVAATPVIMVLMLPLALLARLLAAVRLPRRWVCRPAAMRALLDADVVVDVAGISFVDGRGVPTLVYNVLTTGIPQLLGTPVVKCSQALGPFQRPDTRVAAKVVLGACATICPRGRRTEEHLTSLRLRADVEIRPAADLAFVMKLQASDQRAADELLARYDVQGSPLVAVMPSSVVERYCEGEGIDYVGLVAGLIDDIAETTGGVVLLVPHSARPSDQPGRMNDRPTCRAVHAAVSHDRCVLVDESLRPGVLRALIDRCDALATSRFHAMISALATSTPVMVVGWSHKYLEVLDEFGLGEWVVDFREVDRRGLSGRVTDLLEQGDEVARRIRANLDRVRASAAANLDAVADVVRSRRPLPGDDAIEGRGIVTTDLSGVIEDDMCIGCGACTFADPTVKVTLHPTKLIYQPETPGNHLAAKVCPGVGVDFDELHAKVFPGREVTEYGVVDSVLLAQSTDEPRNVKASSGGLIKELLRHLLDQDDVDGVIALDHIDGLDFEPRLLTDSDQVDELPGSIYHNLAQPKAIELLRENEGRFVVVAIPCQLEGIYKYIYECEPHLADRIHTTIGLLCGWQYSHHSIRAICEYLGADPDDIVDISYRGGGPVGKLRIRTGDGREHSASRRIDFGYQVAFDRHFNTPRCHLCINHSNFLADIVVGDAWLPSTVFTKTGISLVVCRASHTRATLDQLIDAGRVVASEVTTEEIRESQTDRVLFGNFAYAYAGYLDRLGRHRPDMTGPNRPAAVLVPTEEVEKFHSELMRKLELQRAGRYRFLKWRKATVELPRFLDRYWTWFTVRILRIKSLKGERHEVPKEKFAGFR